MALEAIMSDAGANKSLRAAILALLVAADQRCPAIIGQAHVLYHARFGPTPESIEKLFMQLKRDAADLFEAIAGVEDAMKKPAPTPPPPSSCGHCARDRQPACRST